MQQLKFEYIDHTADIGLKVYGQTLAELFENAALGMFDFMTDLKRVVPRLRRKVKITAPDQEALLVNWLSELNYRVQTQMELYSEFRVSEITEQLLRAEIAGEKIVYTRHEIYTELKAVTYHQLYVKQTPAGWESQIIFDL